MSSPTICLRLLPRRCDATWTTTTSGRRPLSRLVTEKTRSLGKARSRSGRETLGESRLYLLLDSTATLAVAPVERAANSCPLPLVRRRSTLMYNHRVKQVDCVDLDPYGTAAPFLDAALQATADGGTSRTLCLQGVRRPSLTPCTVSPPRSARHHLHRHGRHRRSQLPGEVVGLHTPLGPPSCDLIAGLTRLVSLTASQITPESLDDRRTLTRL